MLETINTPRDNALPTYRGQFEAFGDGTGSQTMPKATDVLLDAYSEAKRIKELWRDYGLGDGIKIVAGDLLAVSNNGLPALAIKNITGWSQNTDKYYSFSDWGLSTLCARLDSGGASYFKNVLNSGLCSSLVTSHLNAWIEKRMNKPLALRIYDNVVMAVVSPQFTPYDHINVLSGFLTNFSNGSNGWLVDRIVIDPNNFEMRLINPEQVIIEGDQSAVGGIVVRNGQTGQRKFSVDFYCYTFHCKNGLFMGPGSNVYSKIHRGLDKIYVSDVLHRLTDEYFPRFVNKAKVSLEKAKAMKIDVDDEKEAKKVINHLKTFSVISEKDAKEILKLNIEKYDQNNLGLANAITEYAQIYSDYEKQFQMEKVASKLVS